MSNLEELLKPSGGNFIGRPCIVARIIADLPEPYDAVVQDLVDGPLSGQKIVGRLKAAGIKCSYSSIYTHRINSCGCPNRIG